MAFACLAFAGAVASCGASVLQVTADSTWTEAKQSEINASDGIEIASGATLTLNVGSGATLSIAKVISGGGNLVKDGAGRLDLSGENTFTGEFTVGGTGAVYAYSDGAFGSSAGKTVLYEHLYTNGAGNTGAVGANLYLCGITTSEPIKIVTSDKKAYLYAAASTVNVLNGQLELEGSQASVYALANATLYIRGGIVGVNNATFRPSTASGAKLIVEDLPNTAQMWNAIAGNGQFILNTAGNAGGYTWNPITCGVDWAFNGATLQWKVGMNVQWKVGMKVDLGGHNQRVADISANTEMNGYVTSADKAFLYVTDANANRTSYLPFKGKAGLFFEGTGKTTLYAESETAGDLTVTNGTVAFAAAAGWGSVDAVTVSGKGRLELSAPRQIGIGAAVALADEGVLKTADKSVESVRSLSINGVPMPEGVSYGGTDSDAENKDYAAFFEGTGALFVQVQTVGAATWDGGAGSDDFSAAANWVGDPSGIDLTHGQTMATFAMPGTTRLSASLGADAALYGIVFDDVPSFSFTGTGALRLGAGGLRAPAAADLAPRNFTFEVPLRLSAGDNRWDIGSNVTVRVSSLASDANTALAVHSTGKESGRLVLDGANAGFMGVLLLSNVITRVSGNDVFGSSAAGTTIYAQDAKEGGFTNAVELCGTTNSEPFKVVCDNNGQYAFLAKKGTRNVFNGPVDFEAASMKLQLESNSEVVFAGGGASDKDKLFRPKCASNSRVVITNTPVNWNGLWSDGAVGEIVFSVASNKFDGSFYSPIPIRCTVPYARYQGGLDFNVGGGVGTKLELDGNDQRFNRLFATRKLAAVKAENAGGINSETPATVYLDDTADGECEACFSGAVSLVKEGAHTLALNWRSTSTGTVTVTNGTLRFAVLADTPNLGTIYGSWSNATAFVVRDAGRLEAKHGGVFGAGTDIRLDGANARIELADGTIQRVGEVVLDGKHGIRRVTYGGPASSAKIKDSRISGTGMLWATKGLPGGFIITFR